jgi:hypothetical protein
MQASFVHGSHVHGSHNKFLYPTGSLSWIHNIIIRIKNGGTQSILRVWLLGRLRHLALCNLCEGLCLLGRASVLHLPSCPICLVVLAFVCAIASLLEVV